jgi:hypothetical protein
MYLSPSVTTLVTFCNIAGGWPGEGNIDADPLFVDAPGYDLHLRPGSPCVDAGDSEIADLPARDFEGDPRVLDGRLDGAAATDIGADEYFPCRLGTVNALAGTLADVLFVNGSPGGNGRIYTTTTGSPLTVSLDVPPAGPNPAKFALYVWIGEPDETTEALQPKGIGTMCFPTPLTGGAPQPKKIWNNIGKFGQLGEPSYPSSPAPSVVFDKPSGRPNPLTVTFQGFILDQGSAADKPASITNAVVLKVVD